MSRFELHSVTCPACGHAQEAKIYQSVNGGRIKQAADQIIAGEFGRIDCAACGKSFHTESLMLYTNLPEGVWIVQYPHSARERYATLEVEAEQTFEREYLARPPPAVRDEARSVTRRICFGRAQLAEKLLARRHAIDDRALECLKLVLMRDRIGELFSYGPTALQMVQCDDARITFYALSLDEQRPVHQLEVVSSDLTNVNEGLDDFRRPFPRLFDKAYVNASRYLSP
jgi:hypothetical protein